MLNEKDRRWLEYNAQPFLERYLALAAVAMCLAGAVNLVLAAKIGGLEGHQLADVMGAYLAGFQLDRQYSGVYVKAVERCSAAFFYGSGTVLFTALALASRVYRQRCRRLLAALRSAEE